MTEPAILALEDGTVFRGVSIGATGQTIGEVVFNTSMTGYQEILTDPSYCRQMVTFTYPHIGNTGINSDDNESKKIFAAGLIIRDLPVVSSSWREEIGLSEFLKRGNVVAIAEIDTRKLTRILRDKGALSGCIMTGNADSATAVAHAKRFPGLAGMDLAKIVTTANSYQWSLGLNWPPTDVLAGKRVATFNVVAFDFGIKRNILRLLVGHNCRVTVVPAQTSAEKVLALSPDGVFLSNGPGDPEPCKYAIDSIRSILATDIPVFGICLGHQLLALASGASTVKMKFGHHGANHPVQDLNTGQVAITSQNHGFAVDEASLPDNLQPTHRSLFDNSLQGIKRTDCSAIGFQGHPEASPGPHDLLGIFTEFMSMMQARRAQSAASLLVTRETG
ncbi:MAG: carbamoyl-phosphate synthase small subunit [Chromatiales bacterium]|nr:carbamoyl-phosphate synthase small subunit [Chromatiales bacterium]